MIAAAAVAAGLRMHHVALSASGLPNRRGRETGSRSDSVEALFEISWWPMKGGEAYAAKDSDAGLPVVTGGFQYGMGESQHSRQRGFKIQRVPDGSNLLRLL